MRRSFHLGDTDGAPPGSPPRAGVEVPLPMYRKAFHPEPMDQAEAATHKAAARSAAAAAAAAAAVTANEAGGEAPPAKRPRAEEGPPTVPTPAAPAPAAAAASAAAAPPARAPSPVLVLPPAPEVDLSKLAGRRRVSDLSHPEVTTVRFLFLSLSLAFVSEGRHNR